MTDTWRGDNPPAENRPTIRTDREVAEDEERDEAPVRWNPVPLPNTRPPVHKGRVLQPGEAHPDDKIPKAGEPHVIHETGRVILAEDQRTDLHTHHISASHAGPDLIASVTEPVVPDEEPPPPPRRHGTSEPTKDVPSRAGYRGK